MRPPWSKNRLLIGMLLLLPLPALLAPYLFLGRSMAPLEMLSLFMPWNRYPEMLPGGPHEIWNPLLDSLQQYYPRRVHFQRSLMEGFLPLWDPFVYGGSSFAGIQQGAILYPPAYLLALLPAELQFGWSALLHLSLAIAAGFGFFRLLGMVRPAAAAGAFVLGLNGFTLIWLAYPNVSQWTLCWAPAALYCFERSRTERRRIWLAGAGAALAMILLGGHGQSSAYALMLWGGWGVWRLLELRQPKRIPELVAAPLALGLLLSAGQWLPALDYLPRTDRGIRVPWEQVRESAMPWEQLYTWLLPRLFGDGTLRFAHQFWMPHAGRAGLTFLERSAYPGAAALALLGAAAAGLARRDAAGTAARFGLGLLLLGLLFAAATPVYWPLWRFAPGFGSITATARILWLSSAGLAFAAAAGVHLICRNEAAARAGALASSAAAALAALAIWGIFGGAGPEGLDALIVASGRAGLDSAALAELFRSVALIAGVAAISAALLRRKTAAGETGVYLALPALVALDLVLFGFGFNPAADAALARTRTPEMKALEETAEPFRMLAIGDPGEPLELRSRMPSNLPARYGFGDLLGSDSFVPLRYREWEAAMAGAGSGSPWDRPASAPLRAAGVRFYLHGGKGPAPGGRRVAGFLMEDPGALPYARLHSAAVAATRRQSALLAAAPDRDPRVAIAAEAAGSQQSPAVRPCRARRLGPNRVRVTVPEGPGGILVVSEGWDPGWRARLDGRPANLLPAEHRLIGMKLPAGSHQVDLTFAPDAFRAGFFLTGVGLIFAFALAAARRL